MKKIIAILLTLVMVFSITSVCALAFDTDSQVEVVLQKASDEDDAQYEDNYTLMNFFTDFLSRMNLLIEYIVTVFFPGVSLG